MRIWMKRKRKKKIHPTGKHWMNGGIVSALLVCQLVCAERDRGLNGSQLQELVMEFLWLYLFGHFHYAWYLTWYALEMQYLHLKTKSTPSHVCFVCKHQVVWNSVLSEHFEVIYTGKDGLRWVTFSPENVGQLIYYYYISGDHEYIYPENQQDNNEKDNGSNHMDSLPNTPILWPISLTNCAILWQGICFRASQHCKFSLLWMKAQW